MSQTIATSIYYKKWLWRFSSYEYGNLLSTNQIDKAIFKAEREVAEGAELLDAREALGELRRKHLG